MSSTAPRTGPQLIAYADRLGGNLAGLADLLRGPLAGAFDGVHLLPFFTPFDGADAGFDPVDHTQVDPRLGTWDDVAELARDHEVMADMIVNHVSADSPLFRDVLARGEASEHAGLFLTLDRVFPDGVNEEDLCRIYRPRPGLPLTPMTLGGRKRLVWTTFTPQQVDIDVASAAGQAYLESVLDALTGAGVHLIRLDAVGYGVKTAGTSCFMTPQTYTFIDALTAAAQRRGARVLVEIHSHYQRQIEIASRVDMVYDFALPPLVLHTLYTADTAALRRWLEIRPGNAVTVLDTHDGIGVVDVGPDQIEPGREGLLPREAVDALVERIHAESGGASRQATGWAASNVDVYQVNCTFFDALGGDRARYLSARALQLFVPGIPQVYYVGLLAGANDMDLLARTGVGRDINRHHYTRGEVEAALAGPITSTLLELLRLRRDHPAFGGEFSLGGWGPDLILTWRAADQWAELRLDAAAGTSTVRWTDADQALHLIALDRG